MDNLFLNLPAYVTGLSFTVLLALLLGRKRADRGALWRCAAVIAVNWVLGTAFVTLTANYDPWEYNMFIDSVAMAVVLRHPAWRAQAAIGLLYIVQICCHIAYGGRELLGYPNDAIFYYDALTIIAWAQLLVLGGWACGVGWATAAIGRWPYRHASWRAAHLRNHAGP